MMGQICSNAGEQKNMNRDHQRRDHHTVESFSAIKKNCLLIHATTWMTLQRIKLSGKKSQ